MNTLDLLILVVTILVTLRSWYLGIFRQIFALAGFWGGLFLGAFLAEQYLDQMGSPSQRLLLTLGITLGTAFFLTVLGEYLGFRISQAARKYRFRWIDASLGAVAGGLTTLLTFWLLAAVAVSAPLPALRDQIASSKILGYLTNRLPPAPAVIAQIERAIHASEFPQVFVGIAPTPAPPVETPSLEELAAVVAATRPSVVRIEGISCGELSYGSGFVAAPGLVVTNAHVVAGVQQPVVRDQAGAHRARVVLFDSELDIAILRAANLAGSPLPLDTALVSRGTAGAVSGYPGGGDFSAVPAAVLQRLVATGRDIYSTTVTVRSIYELQTLVVSGNSGGPLLDQDGEVIGVIFGRSEIDREVGYALTADAVADRLALVTADSPTVGTGRCLDQ